VFSNGSVEALGGEAVSRSVSEPDSASLHLLGVANLSLWVKPGLGAARNDRTIKEPGRSGILGFVT